jgi:HK97 gp10 family phage protein
VSRYTHVKNADSLLRKLEAINGDYVKEVLEEACLMVERDAKLLCPVDDGTLRNSITHEVDKDTGIVGTNVEYAVYVHQGTGIYAVNHDGREDRWKYQDADGTWHSTIGQAPNPFLDKALQKNKKAIKGLLKRKLEEEVKNA